LHINYILGKRVGKNAVAETDDMITRYNDALDGLMQQFRDHVDWDVANFKVPVLPPNRVEVENSGKACLQTLFAL